MFWFATEFTYKHNNIHHDDKMLKRAIK